ncbi:MAG: HU family DNA-binding protein [Bacillota bacterium]
MHKSDLVDAVAAETGMTKKDVDKVIGTTLDTIVNTLCNNEKVSLVGFGTFEVRKRSARKGRNPATGEEMQIPAGYVPGFRVSKSVREKVNEELA